jgi:hypothetical protein
LVEAGEAANVSGPKIFGAFESINSPIRLSLNDGFGSIFDIQL